MLKYSKYYKNLVQFRKYPTPQGSPNLIWQKTIIQRIYKRLRPKTNCFNKILQSNLLTHHLCLYSLQPKQWTFEWHLEMKQNELSVFFYFKENFFTWVQVLEESESTILHPTGQSVAHQRTPVLPWRWPHIQFLGKLFLTGR